MRRNILLVALAAALLVSPAMGQEASQRLIYQPPTSAGTIDQVDLSAFARQMVALLEKYHLEADPKDPQYGMLYECQDVPSGKWVDGYARDTMHHMLWTINGMTNYYRATEDKVVGDFMVKYPYSFVYNTLLNSDKLFPGHLKGFLPYWWDDGDSYDLPSYNAGKWVILKGEGNKPATYDDRSSIHMTQDIAIISMNTWWLTRDPKVAEAVKYVDIETHEGSVGARVAKRIAERNPDAASITRAAPAVRIPKQEVNQEPAQATKLGLVAGSPTSNRYYSALRDRKAMQPAAFPDDPTFYYYIAVSGRGKQALNEDFARHFTMEMLVRQLEEQYWYDDKPYAHGDTFFNAMGQHHKLANGKFVKYRSDMEQHYNHPRGYHYVWLSALSLQMLDKFPDLHESYRLKVAPDDVVVRFTDDTPALDGKAEAGYSAAADIGAAKVSLLSDPMSLFVLVKADGPVELKVYEKEKVGPHFATISIAADGAVTVKNWQEQDLMFWSAKGDDGVEVQIPYMIHKPQGDWLNGVEHGRYLVQAGEASKTFYMLSTQEHMKKRLQNQVEGTICNAKAWVDKIGYIPYMPNDKGSNRRHDLSFSGAYGHMLSVIGQYQMWKNGQSDWDMKDKVRLEVAK